ncbi:hypothetical protein D3C73_1566130 [compost metagenome]
MLGAVASLGALQEHADRLLVAPGDHIGAAGLLRIDPAEVVEPIEVDVGEARRQREVGDLLAGGVDEGCADGALVDGTHDRTVLSWKG